MITTMLYATIVVSTCSSIHPANGGNFFALQTIIQTNNEADRRRRLKKEKEEHKEKEENKEKK